ncbi:MAG: hypothetical protein Q9183_001434 [Haloplaca sp. 2 TL-2023]
MAVSMTPYQGFHSDHQVDRSGFHQAESRTIPTVVSWDPSRGTQGTPVHFYLQSKHDLAVAPETGLALKFNRWQCPIALVPLKSSTSASTHEYVLTTSVPPLLSTGWRNPIVPVHLQLQNLSGLCVAQTLVGYFRYTDDLTPLPSPCLQDRKRKLSVASEEAMVPAAKHGFRQQLLSDPLTSWSSDLYPQPSSNSSPASQDGPRAVPPSPYPSYDRLPSALQERASTVSGTTQQSPMLQNSNAPSWKSPYAAIKSLRRNGTTLSANPYGRYSSLPASTAMGQPKLVRTEKSLEQYRAHLPKACLIIDGDLEMMAENWTAEEWKEKRRLVRFSHSQNGPTITARFEVVSRNSYLPDTCCISCIWWEENKGCYITSVDILRLLCSLLGVEENKFSTEEENRIRRNVDTFEHQTIRKRGTDESEEMDPTPEHVERFFLMVMKFEDPKPRNIVKGVKVFEWKRLASSLEKVFGKYVSLDSIIY